jgi:ketosteroid isomerase-like protein
VANMELLQARLAITDLVHRYALNIRRGNGSACVALFTEDAVFEVREAPPGSPGPGRTRSRLSGHAAIEQYLVRSTATQTRVCPLIHNLLIEVNGHEASSTCVMTSPVWPAGTPIIGEYQDAFRHEGGWRFCSRVFTIFVDLPAAAEPAATMRS